MKLLENDYETLTKKANEEMDKAIKFFEKELLTLRTGKASASLVDGVLVEVYDQKMKLRELASISTPDARMIVIHPWDKSTLPAIQKGIQIADLGLNPSVDGDLLRIQLPMMSNERREEIVKQLGKKAEEAKVTIRNARKDLHNVIKASEKNREISEDFCKKLEERLQKTTDAWIDKVVAIAKKKEAELRTV